MESYYFIKVLSIIKRSLFACIILVTFKATANDKLYLAYYDHCPYLCMDKSNESFILQVMTQVYKNEGIDIELVLMPYLRVVNSINSGRMTGSSDSQIIHAAFTVKSDIPDLIFPEAPVVQDKQCFYTLKNNLWKYSPEKPDEPISLAIQSGANYPSINRTISSAKAKNRLTEVSPSNGFHHMLQMLLKGRVDAIFDVTTTVEFAADKLGISNQIKKGWCESNYVEGFIGFSKAYPAKSARLKKIWDKNYPKLLAQGTFDSLFKSYHITKPLLEVQY